MNSLTHMILASPGAGLCTTWLLCVIASYDSSQARRLKWVVASAFIIHHEIIESLTEKNEFIIIIIKSLQVVTANMSVLCRHTVYQWTGFQCMRLGNRPWPTLALRRLIIQLFIVSFHIAKHTSKRLQSGWTVKMTSVRDYNLCEDLCYCYKALLQ